MEVGERRSGVDVAVRVADDECRSVEGADGSKLAGAA
jgi:hypothetical protein